jgi:hypothetical protein
MWDKAIENKVAAMAQAQATVLIHLGTWLRSPSRETRSRLEESLMVCDDTIDVMLRPERLSRLTRAGRSG